MNTNTQNSQPTNILNVEHVLSILKEYKDLDSAINHIKNLTNGDSIIPLHDNTTTPEIYNFLLQKNEYLINLEQKLLPHLDKNIKIISPTGSGKSKALVEMVRSGHIEKAVYYVPTNSLAKQLYNDELNYAKEHGTPYPSIITGQCTDLYEESNIIITNLSNNQRIKQKLKNNIKNYTMILDECHTMTTNASVQFQRKEIIECKKISKLYKNVIQMTATDEFSLLPEFQSEIIFNISKIENCLKNVYYINIEEFDAIEIAIALAIYFHSIGESFKIHFNNTSGDLFYIKEQLEKYDANNILFVNSNTKREDDTLEFINTGDMSKYKGIVSTNCLQNGNSIYNHGETVHNIVLGLNSATDITQSSSRFRNATVNNTYFLVNGDYDVDNVNLENLDIKKLIKTKTLRMADNVYNEFKNDNDKLSHKISSAYDIYYKKFLIHDENGQLIKNDVAISYEIYETTKLEFNSNPQFNMAVMKSMGFTLHNIKLTDIIGNDSPYLKNLNKNEKKEFDMKFKEKEKIDYENHIAELSSLQCKDIIDKNRLDIDYTITRTKAKTLKKMETIIELKEIDFEESAKVATDILLNIGKSTPAFNGWVRRQYNIKLRDQDILLTDTKTITAAKNIYQTFNSFMNSEDNTCVIDIKLVHELMNELAGDLLHQNLKNNPLSQNKATRILKDFYNFEYTGKNKSKLRISHIPT